MENYKTNTHHVIYGDSVGDVVRFMTTTPRVWHASSSRKPASHSWDLDAGWNGAVRMAKEGWTEGATRLAAALSVLMPPNAKETETRYDVAGYFPDVGRYIAGDPACMVRRGRVKGQAPVINIVAALTTSGGLSADCYANFGAALVNIIDRLEAGGRRIELHIVFPNTMKRGVRKVLAGWRVKAAEDHVDLAAVAFSMGHPAAYRRFGFGLWEYSDLASYPGAGYGVCAPFTEADAAVMGLEEALIINGEGMSLYGCTTPQKALEYVRTCINNAAGEELVSLEEEK